LIEYTFTRKNTFTREEEEGQEREQRQKGELIPVQKTNK